MTISRSNHLENSTLAISLRKMVQYLPEHKRGQDFYKMANISRFPRLGKWHETESISDTLACDFTKKNIMHTHAK